MKKHSPCVSHDRGVGDNRPSFSVFRHLAAGYQHGHNNVTFLMVFLIQNTQNRNRRRCISNSMSLSESVRAHAISYLIWKTSPRASWSTSKGALPSLRPMHPIPPHCVKQLRILRPQARRSRGQRRKSPPSPTARHGRCDEQRDIGLPPPRHRAHRHSWDRIGVKRRWIAVRALPPTSPASITSNLAFMSATRSWMTTLLACSVRYGAYSPKC